MIKQTVCFTGPRPEKMMPLWNENDPELRRIKDRILLEVRSAAEEGYTRFMTGMARGIDLLAAEAVLSVKGDFPEIMLVAVIPFQAQYKQQSWFWRKRYENVLRQCSQAITLQKEYTPFCLLERNRYMVDHSSRLIAVDNGAKNGGTAYTIRYAQKKELDCRIVSTVLSNNP